MCCLGASTGRTLLRCRNYGQAASDPAWRLSPIGRPSRRAPSRGPFYAAVVSRGTSSHQSVCVTLLRSSPRASPAYRSPRLHAVPALGGWCLPVPRTRGVNASQRPSRLDAAPRKRPITGHMGQLCRAPPDSFSPRWSKPPETPPAHLDRLDSRDRGPYTAQSSSGESTDGCLLGILRTRSTRHDGSGT